MESSSDYKISNSSLLSLKAEILRKQQEISGAKNQFKLKQQAVLKSKLKSLDVVPKNKGIEERQARDEIEDEEIMEKSKRILADKAKLYNKLVKGSDDFTEEEIERNKQYLVRFDKKTTDKSYDESDEERHFSDEYEPATDPNDEWVEYTDCLGRTRKCLRRDLEFLKRKDYELSKTLDPDKRSEQEPKWHEDRIGNVPSRESIEREEEKRREEEEAFDKLTEDNELLSNDMRRELMRREWEKQEQELMNKKNIHYQDILFNEARTHGVGYYAFSKDDKERAKQQEELKKLRKDTTLKQKNALEQKQLREKQLAARLKAARNRKLARMGLPPEEDEPEPEKTAPVQKESIEEPTEKDIMKEKEEKEKEKLRSRHIRPWDMGKEGIKKTHYEYSQKEWVDKKRSERNKEFAPPSLHGSHSKRVEPIEDLYEEPNKSLFFTSKKKRNDEHKSEFYVDTSVPPPNFKKKVTSINPYKPTSDDEDGESYDIEPPSTFMPTPIVDESVSYNNKKQYNKYKIKDDDSSNDSSSSEDRGRGTEIAPPPTFDYYGPTSSKRCKKMSSMNLEDSIAAGLKYLRELSEKKDKKN